MNLLFLCEGDAESSQGSFSGISKSLMDHFRSAGHGVRSADVDLHGVKRLIAAAPAFSPDRRRWSVRYRLLGLGRLLRTRNASRAARDRSHPGDRILQIGATFGGRGYGAIPYFLYCDSNIKMAERGAETGMSWASSLRPSELRAAIAAEARVYEGAAGIFTMSEYLRQCFIEDFGLSPERVVTAGGGPNFDQASIPPRRPRTSSRPPTALFVGAKFIRKGGDVLLKAFGRVRQTIPDARLRIIALPVPAITEPRFEWLGFLSVDMPAGRSALVEAYSEADVFCVPTRYEPFGVSFLEAMCFGLPCIGTNVRAVPEMVRDGVTGFTVPTDDVETLADRMIRVLTETVAAERMGAEGRRLAHEQLHHPTDGGRHGPTGTGPASLGDDGIPCATDRSAASPLSRGGRPVFPRIHGPEDAVRGSRARR